MQVALLPRDMNDLQRSICQDLIYESIALLTIGKLMRRTIQLDCDQRAKQGVANYEIDVLRPNPIEIGLPVRMTPIRFDQICQPDFGQNRVRTEYLTENFIEVFLCFREQEWAPKIRTQKTLHPSQFSMRYAAQPPL